MPVRQRQPLFFLPDLKDMEVVAQLHESIVNDVRAGMTAKVEVESNPDREMDGRVRGCFATPHARLAERGPLLRCNR